jgi:hypothetical protein
MRWNYSPPFETPLQASTSGSSTTLVEAQVAKKDRRLDEGCRQRQPFKQFERGKR